MSPIIFLLFFPIFQSLIYVECGPGVESLFKYYGTIGLKKRQIGSIRAKVSSTLYYDNQLWFSVPFIDCLQGLSSDIQPPNGAKDSVNQLILKGNQISDKLEPVRTSVDVRKQAKEFEKLFDEMLEIQKGIKSSYGGSSCYKSPCCPYTDKEDQIQYHLRKAMEAVDGSDLSPWK